MKITKDITIHQKEYTMTNKEIFKKASYDSLDKQVGGKHYKNMKIQPAEFINEN